MNIIYRHSIYVSVYCLAGRALRVEIYLLFLLDDDTLKCAGTLSLEVRCRLEGPSDHRHTPQLRACMLAWTTYDSLD